MSPVSHDNYRLAGALACVVTSPTQTFATQERIQCGDGFDEIFVGHTVTAIS